MVDDGPAVKGKRIAHQEIAESAVREVVGRRLHQIRDSGNGGVYLPDPPPRPDKIISHRFDNLIRCLFGKATGG